MSFLLDTNVISEPLKQHPNSAVLTWLAGTDEDRIFLSVITLMELRYGVKRLDAGGKRRRLEDWLVHDLTDRFEGRVLSINAEVADASGRLVAETEAIGRPIETRDALIAATSRMYDLTLVTRNTRDFESTVKNILSPWK